MCVSLCISPLFRFRCSGASAQVSICQQGETLNQPRDLLNLFFAKLWTGTLPRILNSVKVNVRCLSSFCFEDQVIFSTVYLDSENDVRSLIKAHTYLHTTNNGLMPHTDVATGLVASLRYTEHFNRAKLLETKVVDAYVWLTSVCLSASFFFWNLLYLSYKIVIVLRVSCLQGVFICV